MKDKIKAKARSSITKKNYASMVINGGIKIRAYAQFHVESDAICEIHFKSYRRKKKSASTFVAIASISKYVDSLLSTDCNLGTLPFRGIELDREKRGAILHHRENIINSFFLYVDLNIAISVYNNNNNNNDVCNTSAR